MAKWAIFRNFIVTANPDGTVPLNARLIGELTEDATYQLAEVIRRASAYDDLVESLGDLSAEDFPDGDAGDRLRMNAIYLLDRLQRAEIRHPALESLGRCAGKLGTEPVNDAPKERVTK